MRKQIVALSPRDILALEATVGTEIEPRYGTEQAVGVVDSVLNRVVSGTRDRNQGTAYGVVTAPQQYSDISRKKGEIGDIKRPYVEGKISADDRLANARAILNALSGNDSALYGLPGATHYYNPDVANPAWGVSGTPNAYANPLTIGAGVRSHIMGYPFNEATGAFEQIDFARPVTVASPQTYRDLYKILADAGVDDFRDPKVNQRAQITYNRQMERAAQLLPDLGAAYDKKATLKSSWSKLGDSINDFFQNTFKEEVPRPKGLVPVPKVPLDGLTPAPVGPVTRAPLGPTTVPADEGFSFASVYDQPYDIKQPTDASWLQPSRLANQVDMLGTDGVPQLTRFLYSGIPQGQFDSVPTAPAPAKSLPAWATGPSMLDNAARAAKASPTKSTKPQWTVSNDGVNVTVTQPNGTQTVKPLPGATAPTAPVAPKPAPKAMPKIPVSPTAPLVPAAKLAQSGLGFLGSVGNAFLKGAVPTVQSLVSAVTAPKIPAPVAPVVPKVAPPLPPAIAVPTLPVPRPVGPARTNAAGMQLVGIAPSGTPLYSSGNTINGVKQVFAGNPSNMFGGMGFGGGGAKSDTTTKGATSKTGTGKLF